MSRKISSSQVLMIEIPPFQFKGMRTAHSYKYFDSNTKNLIKNEWESEKRESLIVILYEKEICIFCIERGGIVRFR